MGAALLALGVLGGYMTSLGAAKDAADGPTEGAQGLTMEWAFPSPAVGGSVPDDLPEVTSPYPLLDAREGDGADKEDALMADTALALPRAAQPRRRELLFGTAFATAGVVMCLLTLMGAYLAARNAGGAQWLADNNIPLAQPNMQMLTLAMSVVTMQWAVYSISRDDRTHTYLALGVTLLLGAAFVNQTTFLYKQAGVTMAQPEGPVFYAVTGGHLAMVLAGMIFLAAHGLPCPGRAVLQSAARWDLGRSGVLARLCGAVRRRVGRRLHHEVSVSSR